MHYFLVQIHSPLLSAYSCFCRFLPLIWYSQLFVNYTRGRKDAIHTLFISLLNNPPPPHLAPCIFIFICTGKEQSCFYLCFKPVHYSTAFTELVFSLQSRVIAWPMFQYRILFSSPSSLSHSLEIHWVKISDMYTVCSCYNAVFGDKDMEPRYKRDTL